MKTTIFTLMTTMLLCTLFGGCATKNNKSNIACLKSRFSCIPPTNPILDCPSCHATII